MKDIIVFALLIVLALYEAVRIYVVADLGKARTIIKMCFQAIMFILALPLTLAFIDYPLGYLIGILIILIYPLFVIGPKAPKDKTSNEAILRGIWLRSYPAIIILYSVASILIQTL